MMFNVKLFFNTIRYKDWIKNTFVFVPSFFGQNLVNTCRDPHIWFTFISFCLAASIGYVVNDWADLQVDRIHPKNRSRPIPSGQFPYESILPLILILSIPMFLLLWKTQIIIPVLLYLLVTLCYSFSLKNIPILDIVIISSGFILREWAGALAAKVVLSYWLIILTFMSSMFLALGKRRAELIIQHNHNISIRPSLSFYQLKWVSFGMNVLAMASCGLYLAYSLSYAVMMRLGTRHFYYSTIFVVLGFLRYHFVTTVKKNDNVPVDILWQDHYLQLIIFAWIAYLYVLIY